MCHCVQMKAYTEMLNPNSELEQLFRFTGHTSSVSDVCFAPAGNLMASCSIDGSLAVWIPNITGESTFWKGHQAAARSVAFTPDGRQILSASDDKTIKLWNVHKSKYS